MENKQRTMVLDGEWQLTFTEPSTEKIMSAKVNVPCNIEPTLLEMGLIDDYMPADNDMACAVFESVDDWKYTKVFDAPKSKSFYKRELVFEGIDTIAQIYLNGELICDCSNMHLTYRIDVGDKLLEANNKLEVVIRSGELWARNHIKEALVESRHATSCLDSMTFLRKPRYQWGWDNAPRLLTSGIVRSVYIEDFSDCYFDEAYFYTKTISEEIIGFGAEWIFNTDDKYIRDYKIRFTLSDDSGTVYEQWEKVYFTQGTIRCEIPKEKISLWWPEGYGEAKLYNAKLELYKGEELRAEHTERIGIRTIKLVHSEDIKKGGNDEFAFYVNGVKIYAKGTNWKPLHPLTAIADKKTKEKTALKELVNLHCNMVRVWGGGMYEDSSFYDFCNENGIMIWQDFMFACEVPTDDKAYCESVKKEAVQIVKKYRNHPSLAVWCGDNEDDLCVEWISKGSNALPSDNVISRQILKSVTVRNDPYRSFIESSPYYSDRCYKKEETCSLAEIHAYPRYYNFCDTIKNANAKFIGEVGPGEIFPVSISDSIFEREKERAKRLWNSDEKINEQFHQADGYFAEWRRSCKKLCTEKFGKDYSLEDWKEMAFAVNLTAAEEFKFVAEYSRVNFPRKTGVLWWSLIDMWPMLFNVSVIDSEYGRKMPYYWLEKAQQDSCLIFMKNESKDVWELYSSNCTSDTHLIEYSVTAYDENGNCDVIAKGKYNQKENCSELLQCIANPDKPELWIAEWKDNKNVYRNHAITGFSSIETMKLWAEIISEKYKIELSELL